MREDMFKIIVERPRWGSRSTYRPRHRLAGEDDLPVKIGMKRHAAVTRIRCKSLNENLNPLRRYLGRQLGRRWDEVYSEIAATLAPGHTVKEHVRQHLDDFVARRITVGRDGQWIHASGRHRFGTRPAPWHQLYYVDPGDGRLKESASLWKKLKLDPFPWKRRKAESDPNVRVLDKMRELRRIGGIWYEVIFNRNTLAEELVFDLLSRTRVPANTRHAAAKRQLSRAELDAFELKNIYND